MNTTILRLRRRFVTPVAVLLMVVLVVLVAVFPFAWTFITSLKPADELYTRVVRYWPVHPTLAGYPTLFQATQFGHYFLNSAVVSVCTVLLGLTVSTSAAYSFSRYRFPGRDGILFGFLIINMFPQILLLVPLLVIMRSLHMLNTYLGLILAYSTFTIPFSVWMLTGFLDALPRELEEAARVDGATGFQAFFHVILPLVAPGIVATGIYIFINAWNEFLYALTFTAGDQVRTVPVGLSTFIGAYQIRWDLLTAAGVLTSLPIVFAFMIIQKQLIRGLTAGAVKG